MTDEQLHRIARACGLHACAVSEKDMTVRVRSGSRELELDRSTGMIWMADRSHLWVPRRPSGPLLTGADLVDRASERLNATGFQPFASPTGGFRMDVALVDAGGTKHARWTGDHGRPYKRSDREDWTLDSHARLDLGIIFDGAGAPVRIPIVGGLTGGVTFGSNGTLIGMHLAWYRLVPSCPFPLISRQESEAAYRSRMAVYEPCEHQSRLVYEVIDAPDGGRYLQPAWHHTAREGTAASPFLPAVTLPATEFSRPASTVIAGADSPLVTPRTRVTSPNDDRAGWRVGAWWVDEELRTRTNAEAFVREMADAGWTVAALRGGADALKSDWLRDDHRSVEQVDLAFYAGHATARGWMLQPGDGYLRPRDFGAAGAAPHLFGSRRLKWIIIGGCGPLQDSVVSGGIDDVFSRWGDAFSGLHSLCGFATQVGDRPDMGRAAAALARRGETIIHAWLRGARQGQPGEGVWASAMWADAGEGASTFDDHPGQGSIAPTCHEPTRFGAIWTPA